MEKERKRWKNTGETKRVRSAFTVIVSFVCLALVGLALLPLLPVKLSPSRALPGFSVNFTMAGASSRVVEMEVTSKLEAMLARVQGVEQIYSTSGNGFGRIDVELDKHADVEMARFEASTVVRQAWYSLPEGVSYPTVQMRTPDEEALRPFLSFTLNAPSTPILIQQYAEEHIKPRIAALPDVYQVDVSGATPMEWRLIYDSDQLRALGVTVQDIRAAVSQHYQKEFLGTHNVDDGYGGKRWIRLTLMPTGAIDRFDPASIPVTNTDGKLLRLDEVVDVVYMEEEPQSYYRINGLNSIYLSVTATETANQLNLSKEILDMVEQLQAELPPGYEMHLGYNATEYIQEELSKIYFRTGLTVLILIAFVWLISRRLKYLWLIVASLTINICVSFIFYYLFGLEIQLYSLAGITISLNLVIDSTIVMSDHILHRHNLKAYMSVLAATLTTMGALVIIFFLDERIRLNLQDFAAVVIINLAVSLVVSLFFVPAMIDKLNLNEKKSGSHLLAWKERWKRCLPKKLGRLPSGRRLAVYFSWGYARFIYFLQRKRWVVCTILILAFGLPVFMLPERLEGEGAWPDFYNRTLGSATYKESVKPIVDKALGGTLRLFVEKVYEGSYFTRNEEVVLTANANLPNGSTLEQMNTLMKRMETYLSGFKEIRQFQTSIYSPYRASISIYFKREYQHTGFPYTLKAEMISKALELGGGSWSIYGLQDQGFSNDVREGAGSYRIRLLGYNYDELYSWAEKLKTQLLSHRRIKEVYINSAFTWWKDDYQEFYFKLNRQRMARENVNAQTLFGAVESVFSKDQVIGSIVTEAGVENLKLSSRQSDEYDVWAMQYFPLSMYAGQQYKLSDVAVVEKGQMPREIAKENQQYRLCVQYEYIGSYAMGQKLQRDDLKSFNEQLPMGYTAESESQYWSWGQDDYRQYLLLLLVIAIIFFTTSILFNSLKQPLAIIFVIPISYIGVFLTFYVFRLNFDQGGFASFILLCGITVNASIYILNEFNHIRSRCPRLSRLRSYIKAWNAKVIPIFLTVISTVLGFIPFMVGTDKEAFWFPMAAGTIGGLLMSVVGIFFFLPVFCLKREKNQVS